jgi:hypothetical protein
VKGRGYDVARVMPPVRQPVGLTRTVYRQESVGSTVREMFEGSRMMITDDRPFVRLVFEAKKEVVLRLWETNEHVLREQSSSRFDDTGPYSAHRDKR